MTEPRRKYWAKWFPACGLGSLAARRDGVACGGLCGRPPSNRKAPADAREEGRQAGRPRSCRPRRGHRAGAAWPRLRPTGTELGPSPSPRGAAVPRLGVLLVAVFTAAAAPGQRPVARFLPCSVGFFSAEMGTPRRYQGALVRCRPGLRGCRKPGRGSRSSEGSGALGARRTRIIGCRRQSRAPPQVSRPLAVIAFPAHRGLPL